MKCIFHLGCGILAIGSLLLLSAAPASAGQHVNLLLQGEISSDYVHGVEVDGQHGVGVGLALGIPNVASGLFKGGSHSGGASGALHIDLDFGIEVGIFYAKENYSFNDTFYSSKVVRIPGIFWLQINPEIWFGAGASLTQFQAPARPEFAAQYYGALAALRVNLMPHDGMGMALEARYLHGLQSAAIAPDSAFVDGVEAVLSIRFGSI